ncbi:hypothetical protein GCM10009117_04820 [Gangjinia marincola]|uniref:Uncharacterized protein n=1 Tax=Gangjinia marincola TaxID=578463 RepID=A0ABP3XQ31_9FLAO
MNTIRKSAVMVALLLLAQTGMATEKNPGKGKTKSEQVPVMRITDDLIYLTYLNLSQEKVTITIFDHHDNRVFSETIKGKAEVGKIFDFSKVELMDFRFIVKTEDQTFTKKNMKVVKW